LSVTANILFNIINNLNINKSPKYYHFHIHSFILNVFVKIGLPSLSLKKIIYIYLSIYMDWKATVSKKLEEFWV